MPTISYTHPDGFEVYSPQLVGKPFNGYENSLNKEEWLGSLKVDGYWESLYKVNGKVYMFARNVSKKTGLPTEKADWVPHIKKWAEENLPDNTIIVGEIYLPHGTSKDVTTVLGCLEKTAVKRQKDGEKLHLWLHDVLAWNGKNYVDSEDSYSNRYRCLVDNVTNLIDEISIAENFSSKEHDLVALAEEWIANGEEGMVLRKASFPYHPGVRRPKEMFKIKQEVANDIDLVVTNVLDPEYFYTGKEADTWQFKDEYGNLITKAAYYGWKNALAVGAYDNNGKIVPIGRVASGLTDELRKDMAENPDNYINHVVQVKAMSWTEDGALRHPVFVTMREDKNPSECKLSELR